MNSRRYLLMAVKANDFSRVKLLLDKGNSPNERYIEDIPDWDSDRNEMELSHATALMVACWKHNIEIVRLLLQRGADPNVRDFYGNDALTWVCRSASDYVGHSYKPIIVELLKYGAKINSTNSNGWTPLIEAVRYNTKECVELLVAKGAQLDIQDNEGRTAIMFAANRWDIEDINILLGAHARLDKRDYRKRNIINYIQMELIDYSMAPRTSKTTQDEVLKILQYRGGR